MPPNKRQFNYSKVKRIRLPKIEQRKTKSLFEEYFYGFAVAISLIVMILGKAGGMDGYDAILTGLWVGGILWFGRVLKNYRKERAITGSIEDARKAMQAPAQMTNQLPPPNMKPMIGPQWPIKSMPSASRPIQRSVRPVQTPMKPGQTPVQTPGAGQVQGAPAPPDSSNKRAFVYERPTLPDRKPKLPANWTGKPDKKPKQ